MLAWRGEDPENAVYLSQRDVRELQFAKASIATGWAILMGELGITADDVSQVLLAGSFGSYLSPASAVRIGLVPKMALTRIISAGNVAGEGAKMAALSLRERAAADAILDEVEYVELSGPGRLQRPVHRPAGVPGMSAPRHGAGGGRRLRRAGGAHRRHRPPARVGGRRAPAAARAAQPARADRACGRRADRPAADAVRPGRPGLRRLRQHGRGRRARGSSGWPATTATTCSPAPRCATRCARSPARTF